GGVEVDYAQLAPQYARAFGDRFFDDLRHEFRAAEYVHHLDWFGDRRQVGVALLAEGALERVGVDLGIYRNHLEAMVFQQFCDFERVAGWIVGASYDCDRGWLRQNRANPGVTRIAEFQCHLITDETGVR